MRTGATGRSSSSWSPLLCCALMSVSCRQEAFYCLHAMFAGCDAGYTFVVVGFV